jgi:hypothetical protein
MRDPAVIRPRRDDWLADDVTPGKVECLRRARTEKQGQQLLIARVLNYGAQAVMTWAPFRC